MIKGIDFPSKKQLWLIVFILLAILLIRGCGCKKDKPKEDVTPPAPINKQLVDSSKIIDAFKKKMEDSFNLVLQKHYKADEFNNGQFVNLVNQNEELAAINEKMQMELSYPDTCRAVVNKLNSSYNTYVAQTKQTIEQSKKSLSNLRQTIETQKSYLTEKDKLYARLKSNLDTCIVNNAALEKYAKQVKPKRSINLNIQTISPYVGKISPEFGAGIGYVNKKGLHISATYWTNQQISISISKPIIKF